MRQLTGAVSQRRVGPSGVGVFVALVTLTALGAGGYFVLQSGLGGEPGVVAAPVEVVQPIPAASVPGQDEGSLAGWCLHVEHLRGKLVKMGTESRQAQDLIRKVAESTDRDFMQLQTRRLWSADAHMESVRREAEEGLEEADLISSFCDRR